MLGLGNPFAFATDIQLPQPANAVIEKILPQRAANKVNSAQAEILVSPESKPVIMAGFTGNPQRLARQFNLAQKSSETGEDPFEAVRKKAGVTPQKLAGLFAKPAPVKAARPSVKNQMPTLERFGGNAVASAAPQGMMLAYATPDNPGKATSAFSAILSEEDAENEAIVEALPEENRDQTDDATSLFNETPSDGPLPQLRPNVQPALKPLGTAKQVEPQDEESTQATPRSLAYAKPEAPEKKQSGGMFGQSLRNLLGGGVKAGKRVAVYDINAAKVYMPDGSVLEAHSGIGKMADNAQYAHVKMTGPTPPHTYNLKMRESRFHGVEAIRMLPVDGKNKYGRDGFLTHSYLLRGGRAESHGCIAFKDYNRFLNAFKQGKVDQIVVVASGGRASATRVASN